MPLLNVRLNAEQASKARWLRGQGVEISQLTREAIEAEYERRTRKPKTPEEIRAILRRMHELYPSPKGLPPRGFDIGDRKAAREFIVAHLKSMKLRKP
jgi:hypothetical protein